MELTEDQKHLVEDLSGSAFVIACPGAGKTRAVVARYLRRTEQEPRKGIALVSFTNAAIDEVRRRCGDQEPTKAPHFVGTFDSFIHRFLVAPLYRAIYDVSPRLIQSWKDTKASKFRLAVNLRIPDVELSWFDFDIDGRATLRIDRVPTRAGQQLIGLLQGSRRGEAETRASGIYRALLQAGTVSCDASRFLASAWLADPRTRALIQPLITDRFTEVIVDEAQDCGDEELTILQFLRDCGVDILLVGDLDQSIYEFRRAVPERVAAFAATLPNRLALVDNFRSSPAICAMNSALRVGAVPDLARGPYAQSKVPVQVISYNRTQSIAADVLATAEKHGLMADETIIVSHGTADVLRAAGVKASDAVGTNRVAAIVDAGYKLRSSSDGKSRVAALERVERDLVEAAVGGSLDHKSLEAVCEEHSIERRWLRDATMRLCQALDPHGMTAAQFSAAVRARVTGLDWPPHLTVSSSLFRAPAAGKWSELLKSEVSAVLPFSTIHGAKGLEFPAVALVLSDRLRKDDTTQRTVLDDWEQGYGTEARRVLYVGASRAQQLLMLVVPAAHRERVCRLLARDAVPFIETP
ncbi:UvrD-helicase domain-containing protein [Streptomyces spiramyceticus]|uniref:UvrD-helicase domain-containing protein n=1 Tax=Streptomyces spiramyceticus TaxID=299717 RepID=UPI00237B2D1E|nr:ATP-dependent helicase [Streptomyces spiramyceticus]